ncbi:hypothetical protein [Acidothermus cellulolyticus]|uniref:hypothetical protein n=1 Tax=Acidothermus cellulolyticus TaxID=28049 RepID=UPI0011D0F025|nr:hypothetical protein [Acidothermus cellulolyticus]
MTPNLSLHRWQKIVGYVTILLSFIAGVFVLAGHLRAHRSVPILGILGFSIGYTILFSILASNDFYRGPSWAIIEPYRRRIIRTLVALEIARVVIGVAVNDFDSLTYAAIYVALAPFELVFWMILVMRLARAWLRWRKHRHELDAHGRYKGMRAAE